MSDAKRPVAVAVIGAGVIADYHVGGLKAAGGADLVALVGRDAARTAARAAELGIARAETDLGAVLGDPAIEAVVIATPDATHKVIAIEALRAGKAVMLQKPMAMTSGECHAVMDAASETGRPLTVSFMHRYFAEVSWLRQMLPRLGKVHAIRQRNATPGADWADWFFSPGAVAGGVVMQLGVHGIDLVQHIFGPIAQTQATMATMKPERRLADGRTVKSPFEDTVFASYTLAGGALVSHEMSFTERAGCDRFRLELYTDAGTVWLRSPRGPAAIFAPDVTGIADWVVPDLDEKPLGAAHHRHWLDVVRGDAPPDDTAEAGFSTLVVAEHIYAAAESGGRLTIDPPLKRAP
ncbi:MAG: hypothetical protein AcusKO_35470 [Acuticoccus sp.]